MKKKILGSLMALAVVAVFASPAGANCSPGKAFGTFDFDDGVYYYVNFATDSAADPAQLVGALWEPGNRVTSNEGTYTADNWVRQGSGYFYVTGNLGDSRVNGCPAVRMVAVLTDPTPGDRTDVAIGSADETPAKGNFFNYDNFNFVPMPSPRAVASSRGAGNVVVDLEFNDPGAAFASRFATVPADVIDAIVLYQATGDAGRDAAAWVEVARIPYAGGVSSLNGFTVDCGGGTADQALAAGLSLTEEYTTVHVSSALLIECDPTLADPDSKFDLIRERGKGEKRGKPFRDN